MLVTPEDSGTAYSFTHGNTVFESWVSHPVSETSERHLYCSQNPPFVKNSGVDERISSREHTAGRIRRHAVRRAHDGVPALCWGTTGVAHRAGLVRIGFQRCDLIGPDGAVAQREPLNLHGSACDQ